ncbi:protein phosphatase 2C domain-containing protein [Oleidesulfovibrio alaskensis]|uniref:protein phosphatase 2C domain-containing protein n=1 Tax=Oleidesulfovibrio alaskensis TaxID=58180 RepID=UPI001A58B397|nr:protein phosphatase 2C domain-containing protein [Oleidesulfovibrio alaskensis]MBL3582387.1 protein phosphatase 2C domain-containing protein [Oleidesulfovibrio alaskensis]
MHRFFACDTVRSVSYTPPMDTLHTPRAKGSPSTAALFAPAQRSFNIRTVYSAGSGKENEDRLIAAGNCFAVVDGASSLDGSLYDGHTGAWNAACCVSAALERGFALQDEPSLTGIMQRANAYLARQMASYGIDTSAPQDRLRLWSASAAALRLTENSAQWAQIGDCRVMFIDTSGRWHMPARNYDHDRLTMIRWKQLSRAGVRDIRAALHDQIVSVRRSMNRTFGVLNGEPEMSRFLQYGEMSLDGIAHILLFTDGLSLPEAAPEYGTSFGDLARAYLTRGLEGLHRHIHALQSQDPDCRMFPRFKCHDDVAAVALTMQQAGT